MAVTPSGTSSIDVAPGHGINGDGTGEVTLNQGDVLQVLSRGDFENPNPTDLTGTRITSDKPIQVISGHQCSYVPYDEGACDHLEESMVPTESLSTNYVVTAPLIRPEDGDPFIKGRMVRVIATEDDTSVSYDPMPQGAQTQLAKAGD